MFKRLGILVVSYIALSVSLIYRPHKRRNGLTMRYFDHTPHLPTMPALYHSLHLYLYLLFVLNNHYMICSRFWCSGCILWMPMRWV